MNEPIRLVPAHHGHAAETLTQAFREDPVHAYLFPNLDDRIRSMRRLWDALIKFSLVYGEVYTTSACSGVACWLAPGQTETTLRRMLRTRLALPRAFLSFERSAQRRAIRLFASMDRIHAQVMSRPHWYLWAIGVSPGSQGQGIGADLLQPVLAKADAAGLPCYLETQTEGNVAFYHRRGFEVAMRETPTDLGLTTWAMVRQPS